MVSTMVTLFFYLLQGLFLFILIFFVFYVALEVRALFISNKVERCELTDIIQSSTPCDESSLPFVSVLLPIYNESSFVARLVDTVCNLDYPENKWEILVLDDSDAEDLTSVIAKAKVDYYASEGMQIQYIRRSNREGYKAGNLLNGMKHAKGAFYAIFDADFVPPEDFLLETIPCFEDQALGYLQTGIGYENQDVSFLTKFQAMEMGHQQYVTVGLSADGSMASLSGTSCVWRKACVDKLKGLNKNISTEDVDFGYRALFNGWKYAYLRDVVSMSVLPETVSAFRVQRERWGRGLIHSGFKHVKKMFSKTMSPVKKMHAMSVMFSSLLLAAIYGLILLSVPLIFIVKFDGPGAYIAWAAWGFYGLAAIWGLYNSFGARKGARIEDKYTLIQTAWNTYRYISLFLPMAWYYFAGACSLLLTVKGKFHRTPKGKDEYSNAQPPIHTWLVAGEVFTFLYSLFAIFIGMVKKVYFMMPFNITICVGFGAILLWGWQERRGHA